MSTKVCNGHLCEGKEYPLTSFSGKSAVCKKCACDKVKQHQKLNGRCYRNFKNEIKEKNPCVKCGCSDIRLLEFDHISEKNFSIGKSFSKEKIEKELSLTQVLCIWCHRQKTRKNLDTLKEKLTVKFEEVRNEPGMNEGIKCIGELCKGKLRIESNFYKMANGYYQRVCKTCFAYRSRMKRDKNYECALQIKKERGECELCKVKVTDENITCFDFDHLRDKLTTIAVLVRKAGDKRQEIQEEAEKCRLLCCKCHKLHTINQLGFHYTDPEHPSNTIHPNTLLDTRV